MSADIPKVPINNISIEMSKVPRKNTLILVISSLLFSILILVSYFLWGAIRPGFDTEAYPLYLILSIVLTVLSAGVALFILALKTIRPFYTTTYIWVSILVIYAIISNIYLIVVPAIMQSGVDIWYYRKLEVLIHLEEETKKKG